MSLLIDQDGDAAAIRRGTRRFLLLGALLVVVVVAAILVRQGLFRQMATLGFVTDSALELTVGLPVKIAGFRVGALNRVTLRPDGKVEAALEIDAEYLRFVTHDATIELRKEGLIGSSTLEIVPGEDKTRLAANEARLNFVRAEGLTAMANELREQVTPILQNAKTITDALADAKTGLPATLANVQALTRSGNEQVGALGAAAGKVLGKAEEDLGHLGKSIAMTNERLPAVFDKTQKIADHVEKIAADAELTIPPAVRDGQAVIGDVREVVSGVKQAWPVRNFVEPPTPTRLKADSDPRAEGGK
jgi:phospholipid/cholesterol/gamma-HCH transport system substrate-binding protein